MAMAMPRLAEMATLPHSIRLCLAPIAPFYGRKSRGLMQSKCLILRRLYTQCTSDGHISAHGMSKKVSPCSLFVTKMAMTTLQDVPYLLHVLYNYLNNKALYLQKDGDIYTQLMHIYGL